MPFLFKINVLPCPRSSVAVTRPGESSSIQAGTGPAYAGTWLVKILQPATVQHWHSSALPQFSIFEVKPCHSSALPEFSLATV